jgi:hypothetical protein
MQFYFCLTSQIRAAVPLEFPQTAVIATLNTNLHDETSKYGFSRN